MVCVCAAVLIIVPLIIGFVVSRTLAEPTFVLMERFNPEFFELSDRQKVEGAHEVHVHELRLRMSSAIGRAPPLDGEPQAVVLRSWCCEGSETQLRSCS